MAQAPSTKTIPINMVEKDRSTVGNPYNTMIVIMALIANYQIRNILIDMKSSVNINFKFVFDEVNLKSQNLNHISLLYIFSRERRKIEGTITLPIT